MFTTVFQKCHAFNIFQSCSTYNQRYMIHFNLAILLSNHSIFEKETLKACVM